MKARNAAGLSPQSDTVTATVPEAEEEEELTTASHTAAGNILVSNLFQTEGLAATRTGTANGNRTELATSFETGFNTLGYHVTSVQLMLRRGQTSSTPNPEVSIRNDNAGVPGETALYTFTTSSEITGDFQVFTLTPADDTLLLPNDTYWLYGTTIGANAMTIVTTTSTDEDLTSEPDWLIADTIHGRVDGAEWTEVAGRTMRLAILGHKAPSPVASLTIEPAGEDFPGAYVNGQETPGVVTPGTVSSGHLTAGVDTDDGLTGDFWYLDTEPGRSYRVEVTFGDDPGISTGGFAGISFVDPDEVDYVSGCCESDHNREDGATFLHFKHQDTREWNTRYMVKVAAFDLYNTDTAVYNGPYEITLTDITGVEQMVHTFSGGTTEGSSSQVASTDGNSVDLTTSFTTGYHTAGYTLDRIKVVFYDIASQGATPEISIHEHTNSGPGAKLCDIAVPDRVAESAVAWSWTPPHTFLAPACADDILAPSTNYWIVFSDMDHVEYEVEHADDPDEADYYGSGWRIQSFGKRGTSNTWVRTLGTALRIGLWAKEFDNDPAEGDPLARGERKVGATLTGDIGGITDADGLTAPMFTYQWQRVDGGTPTDISGATSDTYTLVDDDVGKRIRLQVQFTDDDNYPETRTGPATSLVVPEPRLLVGNQTRRLIRAGVADYSSSFNTGAHPHSYTIDRITLERSALTPTSSQLADFGLYDSTSQSDRLSRIPKDRLMLIRGPDRINGHHLTFNAPSRVKLSPNATYHIVLTASSGGAMSCHTAGSDTDDSSLSDFSINPRSYIFPFNSVFFGDTCVMRIEGFLLASSKFVQKLEFTSTPTQERMYATGEVIEATATLSEAVTIDGPAPALALQIGDHQRVMEYAASASSATEWVFRYTVTAGDRDDDGVSIERNELQGYADADLSHRGIASDRELHVNAAPRVVSRQVSSRPVVPNWYGPGEQIQFTVEFSLPVTVVGDPQLEFNVTTPGPQNEFASYLSGSGTRELVFSYTVGAGDDDDDGIYWSSNSLRLDSDDAITSVYNSLEPVLDHTALNRLDRHRIDQNPRAVSQKVTSDPTRGTNSDTYGAGDEITFEVVFNQTVTVTGGPRLRFNIGSGSGAEYASYVSGSGTDTLVFSYTVLAADADTDGIYLFNGPLDYPDTATDSIVGEDNSLPAVNEISGANRTVSGHKVDGSITN